MDKNQLIKDKLFLYKLHDGDLTYYGLTKDPQNRLNSHKTKSNNCRSSLLDKDKMTFEILKTLDNITYIDCLKEESDLIRNNECVNRQVSYNSKEDKVEYWRKYYKDNEERIKIRNLKYYTKNIDNMREKSLTYYYKHAIIQNKKYTCLCGGKFTHRHKQDHIRTKIHQNYLIKDGTYPNL